MELTDPEGSFTHLLAVGMGSRGSPDFARTSHREYGHRVGVFRVLGDGQQAAEPANLFVELADAVGTLLGVSHDPDVLHHVFNVHGIIGHIGVDLASAQLPRALTVGQLVLDVMYQK